MDQSEHVSYNINNEPLTICFNMDTYYYNRGVKAIKLTLNGKELIFSKDEIFDLLKKFKGIPND